MPKLYAVLLAIKEMLMLENNFDIFVHRLYVRVVLGDFSVYFLSFFLTNRLLADPSGAKKEAAY